MEENSLSILSLLNSGNFQTYNRSIARYFGSVNAAILFSELVNRFQYHYETNTLTTHKSHKGLWFYYTIEKCAERTCLSEDEQKTAIKILEKFGVFEKRCMGLPAKRHFKMNFPNIAKIFMDSKNVSSSGKIPDLDGGKSQNSFGEKQGAIKEPNEDPPNEPEVNNNPDGLDAPSAVVVPSWDEELDKLNLTDPQKWKIHNEHPEKVKLLVKRVLAWNGRPDDIIAVNTILRDWDDWHDNLTLDERMEKNKVWLQKFKKYETNRSATKDGEVTVTVLSKSIELSTVTKAMSVSIEEKQFVNKVKEMFEKFNLKFEY